MKNLNKLILSLFIITLSLNAQIKTQDINTKKDIVNAKIFSKKGEILGISNLKGAIKISKKNNLQKNDTIEIFHPNYISKKIVWHKILQDSIILMKPDTITKFEELTITANKPEYLILKGGFISYQIIDNVPLTFADGIIEYCINLKKKKFIKSTIIESRTFKNFNSIKKFSQEKRNSTRNILSTIPPFSFYEEIILSDFKKFNIKNDSVLTKQEIVMGSIKKQDAKTMLSIQYHSPKRPKNISLPGIKSTIYNKIINESFNSSSPKLEKIISINKYYNSHVTKKNVAINYELIQNFYTLEKKTMSKEAYKNYVKEIPSLKNNTVNKARLKTPNSIKSLLFKELKQI